MKKVLVLGQDSRSFLTVVRSLGRKNIEVHTAWCPISKPALASRYIAQIHNLVMPPKSGWLDSFIELCANQEFDLIIPCNDESIIPLNDHRALFKEKGYPVYLVNELAYPYVSNKDLANNLARANDISLPKEIVEKVSEIKTKAIVAELGLPVVIKPLSSFASELGPRKDVKKAFSEAELKRELAEFSPEERVCLQENFIGTGVGVEFLANSGEILFAFQHQRVHEPIHGGASSYRKSVSLNPELLDAASALVSAMEYTGVGMIEFKQNLETGAWIFIEINGRFWGSLPLHVSAGADFPYYLFQMMVNGVKTFDQNYKTNVFCRNIINDIKWQVANFKAEKNDPLLATKPIHQVLFELKNVLLLREHIDSLTLDDPGPFFKELKTVLLLIKSKIIIKSPFLKNRTIIKKFQSADSVLFVCLGNINRSPFAEKLLIASSDNTKDVVSAGHGYLENRGSPKTAIKIAKENKIDLANHKSQRVNRAIMEDSDIVFIFDDNNYFQICLEFPEYIDKVYFVGDVIGCRQIEDPDNLSDEKYREVYSKIRQSIDKLIKSK